ncbi:ABC transporter permease [Leuconostocaceae bacterium ESL0723]|nr:ABC transporter permease [Leuconostocaceae bacterium ESL0723]
MWTLTKRNLLYTVRDRTAFALSFLSVAILILVYKAFLGNFQSEALQDAAHLNTLSTAGNNLVNFWLVAGLIIVTSVTSSLYGLNVVVDDRVSGKMADFRIAGASARKIFTSYYLAALILGFAVTVFSAVVGIAIFVSPSALTNLSGTAWLKLLAYILLGNVLAILISMPIILFLKSRSGFSSLSALVSTLIGFVGGIYITVGQVSQPIQRVLLTTPFVHLNALIKNVLMTQAETDFFSQFPEGIGAKAQRSYDRIYGNQLYFPGTEHIITATQSLQWIGVWILVLALVNYLIFKIITKDHAQ